MEWFRNKRAILTTQFGSHRGAVFAPLLPGEALGLPRPRRACTSAASPPLLAPQPRRVAGVLASSPRNPSQDDLLSSQHRFHHFLWPTLLILCTSSANLLHHRRRWSLGCQSFSFNSYLLKSTLPISKRGPRRSDDNKTDGRPCSSREFHQKTDSRHHPPRNQRNGGTIPPDHHGYALPAESRPPITRPARPTSFSTKCLFLSKP